MLVMRRDAREFGVTAVYPDVYPPPWLPGVRDTAAMAHRAQGRRVMHLGDSMVAAGDVGPGQGFADVLSQSTGDDHVNMGVSNSSTDLHLTVFRRWLRRLRGDAAVLHLFTGNDLEEMDRPYSFCDAGPLLGSRAEGMPLRCPQPRWNLSRRVLLGQRTALPRRWAFPGGKVEPGETPLEAARRELTEESGLVAIGDPVVAHVVHAQVGAWGYRSRCFVFEVVDCDPPTRTRELAGRWCAVDEAVHWKRVTAGTRRVLRRLRGP